MSEIPPSPLGLEAYVHVASLSVLIWDILHNLKNDYHLLVFHRITGSTILYSVSRILAMSYALSNTVFLTAPLNSCNLLGKLIPILYLLSVTSSLCLSSVRLYQLFFKQKHVLFASAIALLLAIAGNLTFAIGVSGRKSTLEPSLCVADIAGKYVSTAFVGLLLYHSAAYVAVRHLVSAESTADPGIEAAAFHQKYDHIRSATNPPTMARSGKPVSSDHIPFLTPIILSFLMLLFFLAPNATSPFRLMTVVVYCVCVNILVCRTYRDGILLAGLPKSTKAIFPSLKLDMNYARASQSGPFPRKSGISDDGHDVNYTTSELDGPDGRVMVTTPVMEIEVQKVVEYEQDAHYYRRGDQDELKHHSEGSGPGLSFEAI